jgi:hypothetical protein
MTTLDKSRSGNLSYDGHRDAFSVSITDYGNLDSGEDFFVTVDVENDRSESGQMYVQCSVLDDGYYDFLANVPRAADVTNIQDNCVNPEPFTQIAKISLSGDQTKSFTFHAVTPDPISGHRYVLYCAAFERCWEEGKDSYSTAEFKRYITIDEAATTEDTTDDTTDDTTEDTADTATTASAGVTELTETACNKITDCPGYAITFFTGEVITCESNKCVYAPKPVAIDNFKDSAVTTWAKEHSITLWIGGVILLLLAWYMVYVYQPKPKSNLLG